ARRRAVLRRLTAPVATSAGLHTVAMFRAASALRLTPVLRAGLRRIDCLQVPERFRFIDVATAAVVADAHAADLEVHGWRVDAAGRLNALLDLGVDGLVPARADSLRDVRTARGAWF